MLLNSSFVPYSAVAAIATTTKSGIFVNRIFVEEMKENTLVGEMCAFMLSIVLVKHNPTVQDLKEYFTADRLCLEVNGKQPDESTSIIAAAVHQGLRRSFNTGWKIRFHSMTSEHISHDETMRAVVERRNQLVKLSSSQLSKYSDLRIIHYELNSRLPKIELHTPVVGVVRRKNVSDLGKRYFESMISTALDVVDAEFSSNSEDSVTVLKTITEDNH